MPDARVLRIHYAVRALILFGLAVYIVHLVKTEHIAYYIAPRMIGYVKFSAVTLTVIAVFQGFFAVNLFLEKREQCECEHLHTNSRLNQGIVHGLFLFVLTIGFFTPDAVMGSSLAAKKGIKLNNSVSLNKIVDENAAASDSMDTKENAKLEKMFKADQFDKSFVQVGIKLYKQDQIQVKETGFIETLSIINTFKNNFVGKKVEITGFVYKDNKMKENQLIVARFQVSCCSADANPFGIMVEFDQAKHFAKDSWVKVSGLIGQTNYAGSMVTKILAGKIEKLNTPENPYVYPDYEFYK